MDPSLKPDPNRKGSYYRRIEDIRRALDSLGVDHLSDAMQFLAYYFGCEKLAHGIVGVHLRWPATKTYHHRRYLRLDEIKAATAALGLPVAHDDLEWVFADFHEQGLLQSPTPVCNTSARVLRNTLGHDLGPTNVARIMAHAPFHNPKMRSFLRCVEPVLAYQRIHFSGIP